MNIFDTVIGTIILVLFVAFLWALYQSEKDWQEFSSVHDCQLIRYDNGDTFLGIGSDGKGSVSSVVGSIPAKRTYRCDDGVEYVR